MSTVRFHLHRVGVSYDVHRTMLRSVSPFLIDLLDLVFRSNNIPWHTVLSIVTARAIRPMSKIENRSSILLPSNSHPASRVSGPWMSNTHIIWESWPRSTASSVGCPIKHFILSYSSDLDDCSSLFVHDVRGTIERFRIDAASPQGFLDASVYLRCFFSESFSYVRVLRPGPTLGDRPHVPFVCMCIYGCVFVLFVFHRFWCNSQTDVIEWSDLVLS